MSTFNMHRIVHFDLKGAPPSIFYIEKVLKSIKEWGATGVLFEWEDTFPYCSVLTNLGSVSNAGGDCLYSIGQIQHIFNFCKGLGLEVIQLVQTLGHMEFVLKHECYAHLREYNRSPAVICPLRHGSKQLVQEMVMQVLALQPDANYFHIGSDEVLTLKLMQVLALQPDANYFHIGSDEVWYMGICNECKNSASTNNRNVWNLYLEHVRDLVKFIKSYRPKITVLIWDDVLRIMTKEVLQDYRVQELVQPVVWNYDMKSNFFFEEGMWEKYREVFPNVWAASAYKGANGSNSLIAPVKRYVSNQEAWIGEIARESLQIGFSGIILTGWSRYDHFATLCELLPVAMNSLSNCLRSLSGPVENFEELYEEETLPEEEWPGISLAKNVQALAAIQERHNRIVFGDLAQTWMNSWQIATGFLNLLQVESIGTSSDALSKELRLLEMASREELTVYTGERGATEWLRTFLSPLMRGFDDVTRTVSALCREGRRTPIFASLPRWHD